MSQDAPAVVSTPSAPGYHYGHVVEADDGRACRVRLANDATSHPSHPLPVVGHARDLGPIVAGDEVIALIDPHHAGVFILAACARADERPREGIERAADGTLVVRGAGAGIRLETEHARLEITGDGSVLLDGRRIDSRARETHRIQGGPLEFN